MFVGDELTVNAEVIDKDEALKMIRLKIIIKNQDNKKVSRSQDESFGYEIKFILQGGYLK